MLFYLTSAQESQGGEALPGVGVAEDGGEGQDHGQAVHLGHVVIHQGQQSVELQAGALQRHPPGPLLDDEVVHHEAVLVAELH